MKSVSSKRTFLTEEIEHIKSVFWPLMEQGSYMSGVEIDKIANENFKDIFDKYGRVKIRNKYRELKARFLRQSKIK